MKRFLPVILAVVLSFGLFFLTPAAHAFDVFGSACQTGGADSAVCQEKAKSGNPLVGSNGVLISVANVVATFAGVAAMFYLVYAGWMYITSGGDTTKVQTAKSAIQHAVIGLVVIALADVIVGFVISKL